MSSGIDNIEPVEFPIDLNSADKAAVLFYLAGRVPVSVSELAEKGTQHEGHVRTALNRRFQNEIKIDQTGFLTLTDAARTPVLSEANSVLTDATDIQKRAQELIDNESYEQASERYRTAAELFAEVQTRLSAVSDVPSKLSERVESVKKRHDDVRKEHVKDTLAHRKLLAEQRENAGDKAVNAGEYARAVEAYTDAIRAFEEAKEIVEAYNDRRLSASSSSLDASMIDRLIETLKQKLRNAEENHQDTEGGAEAENGPSTGHTETEARGNDQPNASSWSKVSDVSDDGDGDSSYEEPTVDTSLSRGDIVEEMKWLEDELTADPRLDTLLERTTWSQHDVLTHFESWQAALDAAEIDNEQALIADIRQTANVVDGVPTTTDQNDHGRFSAGMYYDVFDSWDDALASADLLQDDTTNTTTSGEHASEPDYELDEQPSDFPTLDVLPLNERFSGEIAVKVEDSLFAGSKRDAALEVSDVTGVTIRFDFWSTHDLEPPDSIGTWYVVEEVRLKQWESDGETKQNLSSTRDTTYRRLDGKTPTDDHEAEQPDLEDDSGERQKHGSEETSSAATATPSADETAAETGKGDSTRGMLESIEDEFADDLM